MLERFTSDARAIVEDAIESAAHKGDSSVEPEHLLLAIATREETHAADALAQAGLDRVAVEDAIAADRRAVLAAVGVVARDIPVQPDARTTRPRVAPATKAVLNASLGVAHARRDRRIGAEHILLALAGVETGRVARLFERAGVDAHELAERLSARAGGR